MIRLREFTPSDDVLDAIRSLRADDDGLEPLERESATTLPSAAPEAPRPASQAIAAKYDFLTPGRYLRVKV